MKKFLLLVVALSVILFFDLFNSQRIAQNLLNLGQSGLDNLEEHKQTADKIIEKTKNALSSAKEAINKKKE